MTDARKQLTNHDDSTAQHFEREDFVTFFNSMTQLTSVFLACLQSKLYNSALKVYRECMNGLFPIWAGSTGGR